MEYNSVTINSIETRLAILTRRADGIVELRFKVDKYEVDVPDQIEFQAAYAKLTDNGRIACSYLAIPGTYGGITKEAREMEIFQTDLYKNVKCIAIVITSLPQRILGTAYFTLKKKKTASPFRFFKNEEEALEWITTLTEATKNKHSIKVIN